MLLSQGSTYTTAPAAQPYRTGPVAGTPYQVGPGSSEEPGTQAPFTVAPPVNLARTGVTIDAYDKRVESRWAADDPFYTSTVRGGAAIAQSRQGQLDGGWTLAGDDGGALYVLQLVDAGEGWIEGAWRKDGAGTANGPAASGYIALISRESGRVVLRFLEPGAAAPTAVTLEPAADGSWRGQAARANGTVTPVRMLRR